MRGEQQDAWDGEVVVVEAVTRNDPSVVDKSLGSTAIDISRVNATDGGDSAPVAATTNGGWGQATSIPSDDVWVEPPPPMPTWDEPSTTAPASIPTPTPTTTRIPSKTTGKDSGWGDRSSNTNAAPPSSHATSSSTKSPTSSWKAQALESFNHGTMKDEREEGEEVDTTPSTAPTKPTEAPKQAPSGWGPVTTARHASSGGKYGPAAPSSTSSSKDTIQRPPASHSTSNNDKAGGGWGDKAAKPSSGGGWGDLPTKEPLPSSAGGWGDLPTKEPLPSSAGGWGGGSGSSSSHNPPPGASGNSRHNEAANRGTWNDRDNGRRSQSQYKQPPSEYGNNRHHDSHRREPSVYRPNHDKGDKRPPPNRRSRSPRRHDDRPDNKRPRHAPPPTNNNYSPPDSPVSFGGGGYSPPPPPRSSRHRADPSGRSASRHRPARSSSRHPSSRSKSVARPQKWNAPYDGPPPDYFDDGPNVAAGNMLNNIMGEVGQAKMAYDISRRSVSRHRRSVSRHSHFSSDRRTIPTRRIEAPRNPDEWLFSLIKGKMVVQCRAMPTALAFTRQPTPREVHITQQPSLKHFNSFMHLEHKLECPHWIYELFPQTPADARAYDEFLTYLLRGRSDACAGMALDIQNYKVIILPPGQEARFVGYEKTQMVAIIRKNLRHPSSRPKSK
ncbi:hypothetical protein DYB25_006697 [Aphanomyces astaci]|uniref:Spen paralogue and orthologue SPOC C-terminal domain-containing protein n=1 Tax=Aphanomyces astaci TaxID=112090 RepID=A0A396ZVQ5_APHAT|nr:hypothetical protein DYB25_006697 [Aphanomyces astaci]